MSRHHATPSLLLACLLVGPVWPGCTSDDSAEPELRDDTVDSDSDVDDARDEPDTVQVDARPDDTDDGPDDAEVEASSDTDTEDDTVDRDVVDASDDAVEVPPPVVGEPSVIPDDTETREIGSEGPCGVPTELVGRGLRRSPYVQSVFTDSARIAWTDTLGAAGSVRYSIVGSGEWRMVDAEVRHFPVAETDDTEAYNAYDATLLGLEPGVDVCYELFVDGALVFAGGAFHTAWTTHDRPVSIVAMGDSGNASPEQYAVGDQMVAVDPDVFLHLGDMAYGDGTFVEFEERVFAVYEAFMGAVPAWPTPGNHEYKTGFADGYIAAYYLPEQAWNPRDDEYYYSFDYGNVHFVSIDSNEFRYVTTIGSTGDDMLDWLEHDLGTTEADWKIAFMHHPIYSSGSHGRQNWLYEAVLPILERHQVDLVLAGHDHHYERSLPLWGDTEVSDVAAPAITYIVAGAGGAGLRDAPGEWWTAAVDDTRHSFLHLVIDGCEGRARAIDLEGEELDAFTLDGCRGD